MAGAAPAIDYNQLAVAAIAQAAQAAAAAGGGAAAGGAPAAPPAIGRYAGDGMDIERLESHVSKWLSTNCVDVNATVLQNVRLFMDHISNVYKEKVLLYETRDAQEAGKYCSAGKYYTTSLHDDTEARASVTTIGVKPIRKFTALTTGR